MLKRAAYFVVFLAALMVAAVVLERTSSPFFQGCIIENENSNKQTAAKENPTTFGAIVATYIRCSGRFIDRHDPSITALATIIIAAFTFTLWQSTEKLWRASEKQFRHAEIEAQRARVNRLRDAERFEEQVAIARDSANAARMSAQAAIGVEIARVLISNIEFQWNSVGNLVGNLQFPKVTISVKNYGRTPAFVSNQASEMLVATVLPEIPEYPNAHDLIGCVIEGKDTYDLPVARLRQAIPMETIDAIVKGKTFVWIYGHLFYRDFLHDPHWLKFCAQLFVYYGEGYSGPVRVIEGGPAKYTESY
jgi:hypothetical protein